MEGDGVRGPLSPAGVRSIAELAEERASLARGRPVLRRALGHGPTLRNVPIRSAIVGQTLQWRRKRFHTGSEEKR